MMICYQDKDMQLDAMLDALFICYHCVDFLATDLIDWYLGYQPYSNYGGDPIGGYVSHVPAT